MDRMRQELISINRYFIEDYDGSELPKKLHYHNTVLTHHLRRVSGTVFPSLTS